MTLAHLLLFAGSLGFGVISALIPIFNAEAYVIAVCATAAPWPATFALGALTIGTVGGKVVLFLGARHRDQLGRWLGRHGPSLNAAEVSVVHGVTVEIDAGEAEVEHARSPTSGGGAVLASPAQAGRRRRWLRWLPPAPGWLVRFNRAVMRWSDRALGLLDQPWQAGGVLLASATIGIPPLAITPIAAGLRKTSLPLFVVCVATGRAFRFALIAVPTFLAR